MRKGLVFGKYMPVHKGHLALIEFAKSHCDQIIVSMSFTLDDPIDHQLRFGWLKEIFKEQKNIEVVEKIDDFHDDSLPIFEATKSWAIFIHNKFPDIDAFFCSEDYGEPLSFHLGLPCFIFDKNRDNVSISATKIRQNPYKYWNFIPGIVQPYFIKKICLYGPESVGKTVLSKKLAQHFNTNFVQEAARDILTSNDIDEKLIIEIGKIQTQLVHERVQTSNKVLFCDTDVITTQIYAKHYLGYVPKILFDLEKDIKYDFYLLLDIDVDWVADPLRDLGNRRKEMFEKFKQELDSRNIPYQIISGSWGERMKKITKIVEYLLNIE
jgi:HTH-type transcriptional repressor of NAD biosynthesis genes